MAGKDVSSSVIPCFTEEEIAVWRGHRGFRIVRHLGRYWWDLIRGFYQPIHHLARFGQEEATAPKALQWGFRAVLADKDAGSANGSIPVHVLAGFDEFCLEAISSDRRSDVRRCRKLVEIVEPDGPDLIREQGHAVAASSILRTMGGTRYSRPPSHAKYVSELLDPLWAPRLLYVAGLVDGRLGGYMTGYSVDGTAYIHAVHIETTALKTSIGSGLLFEFIRCCRRTAGVRELSYGIEAPEKPTLGRFKASWGFPVRHFPTRFGMNPLIGAVVRRLYPEKYYRLTGGR